MEIRPRLANDLDECVRIFTAVHHADGYPLYLRGDLADFVASNDELGAWVATDPEGRVLGHVGLHRRSWNGVMEVARDALDCGDDEIAVVARLVVAPSQRRAGVGRALLSHAARAGTELGRMPILDVAARYEAAVALYDAAGWRRIGRASFPMPDGTTAPEIVFAGPAPPT